MNLATLPPFNEGSDGLNVIIETPKDSRNKFTYDLEREFFQLKGTLPVGASFPYDFGFVPSTLGEDGDPLDVLVLMEEPAFAGCLVEVRLIGVLEVEQTEDGHTEKNDRLIAVFPKSPLYEAVQSLNDLSEGLLHQIEHFFKSYNEVKGGQLRVTARRDASRARELIGQGEKLFKEQQAPKGQAAT